jgi:glutamyl-tRNA synthetase
MGAMNKRSVRVRFAPSPTGHLHIGGLRTALFNWLFARHTGGAYLLRIEDTDASRDKVEYVDSIFGSFEWTGIMPDEQPIIQSTRITEHRRVIEQLVDTKKAYKCYCAPDDHVKRLQARGIDTLFVKYDGYCRTRDTAPDDAHASYAVRFAIPHYRESVIFEDLIRGRVEILIDQLDDFVIARSIGAPMYNFVVVVDDAFMGITHVIRAEEHLVNTPKQILLYEACQYPIPQFAHVPLILGPSGDKLSKRDGAVSVLEYRQLGYLPAALINYLARLGWAHGDQEIFSTDELISYFTLEAIGKKGAIFDPQKLDWVNSIYIRGSDNEKLLSIIQADVMPTIQTQLSTWSRADSLIFIGLYKERISTLKQLSQILVEVHNGPSAYVSEDRSSWITVETASYLRQFIALIENDPLFTLDTIKEHAKHVCKHYSIKLTLLAQPIRISLIGSSSGPGAFELVAALGKQVSIKRMHALLNTIG